MGVPGARSSRSCWRRFSFRTALREANKSRGSRSLFRFVREARQPELPVVLLEDAGALVGLVFALFGVDAGRDHRRRTLGRRRLDRDRHRCWSSSRSSWRSRCPRCWSASAPCPSRRRRSGRRSSAATGVRPGHPPAHPAHRPRRAARRGEDRGRRGPTPRPRSPTAIDAAEARIRAAVPTARRTLPGAGHRPGPAVSQRAGARHCGRSDRRAGPVSTWRRLTVQRRGHGAPAASRSPTSHRSLVPPVAPRPVPYRKEPTPMPADHARDAPRLQGRRPVAGRVRPQRDPPGRARDARPDGAARGVRRRASRWPAPGSPARCT